MKNDGGFKVLLDNKQYDIKSFLKDHPGGVKTLQGFEGKSVRAAMEKFEHSTNAYHLLNDFKLPRPRAEESIVDPNLSGGVSENGRLITKEEANRSKEDIQFLEDLEARLDWSKPLLSQLANVMPYYHEWVNSAVYRKCRLFSSPILEALSYTPWYIVPMFWIPIILYLGLTQYAEKVTCEESRAGSLTTLEYVAYITFGVCLWTIIEYSLHRWVFHLDPGQNLFLIKLHFLMHGMHHKVPFDGLRQVFPPVPAVFLLIIIYTPIRLIFNHSLIILTGGITGYLTYDMIHYHAHHGSPAEGTYLYAMKRYHSNHHFVNHDRAYGISNDIWDHVFNTFVKVRRLEFSLEW